MSTPTSRAVRIDKWLWYARFFKSRTLAGKFVNAGKVRINEKPTPRAHATVSAGDVLTFSLRDRVRVIRVVAPGTRRGPASEAQALYEDLSPPMPARNQKANALSPAQRLPGSGRPTKAERRAIDRLRDGS